MIHDQHIHSHFSPDSTTSLEEYVKKAHKLGIRYFITCDHMDYELANWHPQSFIDFQKYDQEIAELKIKYPDMIFLKGIEIGYRDSKRAELNEIINGRDFDLVNLSIHDNCLIDYYDPNIFKHSDYKKIMNDYYDCMLQAITNFSNFDVLSHLDYTYKTLKLYDCHADFFEQKDKIVSVLKRLIEMDKVLEINIKVQKSINDDSHLHQLLSLYKSLGGTKLSLSSDAHTPDMFMFNFDKYISIIKEEGFNTLSYFIKRKEYQVTL